MIEVHIPTVFRAHTDGHRIVELDAGTVGQLLEKLTEKHPDLRNHLFGDDGEMLSFLNVFVNDDNIRDLAGNATELTNRDEVILVPAMAGG